MTGNAADAEEIMQETFVRALERPPASTTKPWLPWLTKVAINLSRDLLRRRRRRDYVGEWLPSPIPDDYLEELEASSDLSPAARYDLRESISIAFLCSLEALTPTRRAVLLLRDAFDYSTSETADVLGMTEANVKVTLHRARREMRDYERVRVPRDAAWHEMAQNTLDTFLRCLAAHDFTGLERLLSENVVVISDGGGEVTALLKPMHGREKVLRLLVQLYQAYRDVMQISVCSLNNQPAAIVDRREGRPDHASRYTLQCEHDEVGLIRRLNFVFAPSKLSALENPIDIKDETS